MEIGCCDLFARGRFWGGYLARVSLYFAASNIYTEIVKILVKNWANVNEITQTGNTCFWTAAESGNLVICAYLNDKDIVSLALCIATKNGNTSTFEFILSKNVSPNFYGPPSIEFIENFYDAPLVYASLNGNIEMVNLLYSKKACVNVKYCNIQRFYTACKLNSLE